MQTAVTTLLFMLIVISMYSSLIIHIALWKINVLATHFACVRELDTLLLPVCSLMQL